MLALFFVVSVSLSSVLGRDIVMSEAVKHTMASSFNESANLLHIAIQTEFDYNIVIFLDMLNDVLKENWNFRIQLDVKNKGSQSVGDNNLWFIDSYTAFRQLLPLIRAHGGDSPVFYLIVFKLSTNYRSTDFMRSIFSDMFLLMVANVNILIETATGEVLFYTFFPYQKLACRSTVPVLVNRFFNNTMTTGHIFPAKADNFHGCPLRVVTSSFPSFMRFYRSRRRIELKGFEGEILTELAARMNFTFQIIRPKMMYWGEVLPNGTSTGPFKLLEEGRVDVLVGFYLHDPFQDLMFTASLTYYYTWLVLALRRPPYRLPKLSWLFAPFDRTAWACILMLLIVTAGCISFAKSNARLMRFLQLQSNSSTILNILAVSMGMSLKYLPKMTFHRLCFIMWSLGVLVIRSTYQGKLFDSYRRVIVSKPHLTVGQLLDQHYTIYSRITYANIIDQLSGITKVKYKELTSVKVIADETQKNALIGSFAHIMGYFNPIELENVVAERLNAQQVCMYFQQHSIMARKVNTILLWMDKAGLLQHWKARNNLLKRVIYEPQETYVPGPVTLGRFKYIILCFIVLYAMVGIVFVLELSWKRLQRGNSKD